MQMQYPVELRWRQAIEAGDMGVWDLRPELETVHYSPQWKQRLGYPDPHAADSTHFWRCRVHPDDLEPMLTALRAHTAGGQAGYETTFRLRSNGSGYRVVHSRGRAIERRADGRVLRMVGTMIDLTGRPSTPRGGLADGTRGAMEGVPMALPFHRLLCAEPPAPGRADEQQVQLALEQARVLALVEDLLHATVAQLEALPNA
ncbi:PAS domain-containing protein [Sphaerotilaceae bacterium SBD11-9]